MSPRTSEQLKLARIATNDKILTSSLKVFSLKGFFNTSIREIAQEANISVGLLYNYFDSKEALALSVLQSAFQAIDKTIIVNEENSPAQNIETSISDFIELIQKELDKIRLLAQMSIHGEKFDFLNKISISKYQESVMKFEKSFSEMGLENSKMEAKLLVAILWISL